MLRDNKAGWKDINWYTKFNYISVYYKWTMQKWN